VTVSVWSRGGEEWTVVTELIKPLYIAEATVVGGREGHARSADGILDVDLRPPVEMGGPGGGTNPEELFAAGYAACFQSALAVVARRSKVSVDGSTVTGKVTIGTIDGGAFGLSVQLEVHIPDVDEATTTTLMEGAHQVCPYSNATRGNIAVTLTAV
jgi:lipoyl-dependent peroxiredoxin